ncbi:MAG: hypothetical protein R3F19_05095 [Verrucomicrobiales bacterium]
MESGPYGVHLNRDEKKTRVPGESPAVINVEGVRCMVCRSQRDLEGEGTWIHMLKPDLEFGAKTTMFDCSIPCEARRFPYENGGSLVNLG